MQNITIISLSDINSDKKSFLAFVTYKMIQADEWRDLIKDDEAQRVLEDAILSELNYNPYDFLNRIESWIEEENTLFEFRKEFMQKINLDDGSENLKEKLDVLAGSTRPRMENYELKNLLIRVDDFVVLLREYIEKQLKSY